MKKLKSLLLSVLVTIVSIFTLTSPVGAETTLSYGYASGYSNWSTTKAGVSGEVSKTFYRYRDVASWSSSINKNTSFPTFYKTGTYSYVSSTYSCNCHQESSCGGSYSNTTGGCRANWCTNGSTSSWSCACCRSWGCYFGSYGGGACYNDTNYYTSCSTCNSYSNATGWYAVASWGSWSAYQATSVSQTTSRQVETITMYSYPLSYTINYNANGGSGSMSATKASYTTNTTLSGNSFTRTGYTFLGWSTSSSATSANVANGASVSASDVGASPGGSVTLYAIWQANEYTYNVVYKSSTGKDLGGTSLKYKYDTTNTVVAPEMIGYTTPDSQTIKWDDTNSKTITFTYPIITYNISYDVSYPSSSTGGANDSSNPSTYTVEDYIEFANPIKVDYLFKGWYTDSSFANRKDGITEGETGDLSLYAYFEAAVYNYSGSSFLVSDDSTTDGVTKGDYITDQNYNFNYTPANGTCSANESGE